MATSIAIVSDTHLPKGRRELPEECLRICRESDLIVHAGDFMKIEVLEMFECFGPPVLAVSGNVDSAELQGRLPETVTVEVESARLSVIHDSGPRKGRLNRMRRRFPDSDAVIFGHSHLPLHEEEDGFQIFNPGSPTERRRSPFKSMGKATVEGDRISFKLVDLGI